ncbi:hypothetical protein ACF09J_07765 [Streptomyces sp. NPDC014889]|uniref:hypothetical protein n=1 Tax=Streptomyces sp. NPDC014889 TaxID=3364928 RepID=UPI0036FE660E
MNDEQRIRALLVQQGVSLGDATPPDPVTSAAAAANAAAAQPQPSTPRAAAAARDDWWDALYADEQPSDSGPDEEQTAQPQPQPQRKPQALRSRIPDWWTGQHADLTPDKDEPDADEEEDTPDADPAADQDEHEDEDDTAEEAADDSGEPDTQPQPSRSRTRLRKAAGRIRPGAPAAPASAARALVDEPAPRLALVDAYARVPLRIRWLVLHGTAAAAGYRIGWVQFSTRTAAWIADHGLLRPSSLFWYAVAFSCELLRRRFAHRILVARWAAAIPIASIVTGTLLYGTGWHELELPL